MKAVINETPGRDAGMRDGISLARRIMEEQAQYGRRTGGPYARDARQQMMDHLTIILGFSQMLINCLEDDQRLSSYARQINKSARLFYDLYENAGEIAEEGTHADRGTGIGR